MQEKRNKVSYSGRKGANLALVVKYTSGWSAEIWQGAQKWWAVFDGIEIGKMWVKKGAGDLCSGKRKGMEKTGWNSISEESFIK